VYFKRNNFSNEEIIQGIYKAGSTENLINSSFIAKLANITTSTVDSNSLYITPSQNGTIKNATFTVEPNTTYYIIAASNYNDTSADMDIGLTTGFNSIQVTFESYKPSGYDVNEASGTPYPRSWHSLVPNVDTQGNSIIATVGAQTQERYFRHSFNSGTNTQLNVFLKSNSTVANDERIMGIYRHGYRNNLLRQGQIFYSPVSGIGYAAGSTSTLAISNNLNNDMSLIPNATLTTMADTTYYIIVKTIYNTGAVDEDIEIDIQNSSRQSVAFNYVSTQIAPYDMYEASGATITVTGGSIIQRTQISAAEARITANEAATALRLTIADHNTKVSELEGKINARVPLGDSPGVTGYTTKIGQIEGRIGTVETKTGTLEGQATNYETRIGLLEGDISGRVQSEINKMVAQTVFDTLKTELETKDTYLNTELTKRVEKAAQKQIDDAQDALIAAKVNTSTYTTKIGEIDAKDSAQDAVIASKLNNTVYTNKIAAIEEFINLCQAGNYINIQIPNTNPAESYYYVYTGTAQNVPIPQ
jgi:hypothetical protein